MMVELTKKQLLTALDDYIDEELSTEEYEKFILRHIRRYAKFDSAYFSEIAPAVEKLAKR